MAAWYAPLLDPTTTAGLLTGLTAVGGLGLLLGALTWRGIYLGAAGCLFVGMAWGVLFWGERAQDPEVHHVIHVVREFGLILFVYAIGLTVGPGFVERLKAQGLVWNLLAVVVVLGGVAAAVVLGRAMSLGEPLTVGLLCGAVTNTPSLAAAQQTMGQMADGSASAAAMVGQASAGYALAYPLGIVGIIASMLILKPLCQSVAATTRIAADSGLSRLTLRVINPGAVGLTIGELRSDAGGKIIVSRFQRGGDTVAARDDQTLALDDCLLAVGREADLRRLRVLCGGLAEADLAEVQGPLVVRQVLVSKRSATLKRFGELDPTIIEGVTLTRVHRSGIELLGGPDVLVHLGDRLRVVGSAEALDRFAAAVGDSVHELEHPRLPPLLIGIVLGVVLGSIPLALPGLPAALKLGLAGGPLLVALLVASRGRLGPFDIYLPSATIGFMREFGIMLFLSCVGLLSGQAFVGTLQRDDGPLLLGIGVFITMLPLLAVGLVARFVLRKPYGELAGLFAGSMTDPPALAFAQATAGEAPARIYATVYPLTMLLRIATAQAMLLLL
jgi:putative transport protein